MRTVENVTRTGERTKGLRHKKLTMRHILSDGFNNRLCSGNRISQSNRPISFIYMKHYLKKIDIFIYHTKRFRTDVFLFSRKSYAFDTLLDDLMMIKYNSRYNEPARLHYLAHVRCYLPVRRHRRNQSPILQAETSPYTGHNFTRRHTDNSSHDEEPRSRRIPGSTLEGIAKRRSTRWKTS